MTKAKTPTAPEVSVEDMLSAAGAIKPGDKVIVTFSVPENPEEGNEGGVNLALEVVGVTKETKDVPFTPQLIFGETIARIFKRPDSLWPLAKLMVPEAFISANETKDEAATKGSKKSTSKKSTKKKAVKAK